MYAPKYGAIASTIAKTMATVTSVAGSNVGLPSELLGPHHRVGEIADQGEREGRERHETRVGEEDRELGRVRDPEGARAWSVYLRSANQRQPTACAALSRRRRPGRALRGRFGSDLGPGPSTGRGAQPPDHPTHRRLPSDLGLLVANVPGLPGQQDENSAGGAAPRPTPPLDRPDLAGDGLEEHHEVDVRDVQPLLGDAAGDEDREPPLRERPEDLRLLALGHAAVPVVPGRLPDEPTDGPPLPLEPLHDPLDGVPVL